jgi:acyl-CoA thioesterase I
MRTYVPLAIAGILALIGLTWFFFASEKKIINYPPKNAEIVAFGDSLVFGTGATAENDFVSLLSKKVGRPIVNLGVPGDTTADGLSRIDEVLSQDHGTVILLLGGNDYLRKIPKEQTFANLASIITKLQEQGIMVVLLGVRGGFLRDDFLDQFDALAEDMGVIYVPDVLRGLLGNNKYMSDTIHPNDAGYAHIAQRVFEAIETKLR